MKNSIAFVLIAVAVVALGLYLPWWFVAPLCFIVAYTLNLSWPNALLISFLSVFVMWLITIYLFDNGSIERVLGGLLNINANFTPILSASLGGILSGIFGVSGALLAGRERS